MIQEKIRELVNYGLLTGLVEPEDEVYTVNRLLELFGLDEFEGSFGTCPAPSEEERNKAVAALPGILEAMLDYAAENGILKEDGVVYRDLLDTKIMSCLLANYHPVVLDSLLLVLLLSQKKCPHKKPNLSKSILPAAVQDNYLPDSLHLVHQSLHITQFVGLQLEQL